MKNLIKKGNKVIVITGDDKGKQGEVIQIDRLNNKVIIKDVNFVKNIQKQPRKKKVEYSRKKVLFMFRM